MRYFFEIAYKGTDYHGWQVQQNATSVQGVVNAALSTILRKESIVTTGSGRTDTGVHCEQQFFHLDLEENIIENDLLHHLNSMLPKDIAIKSIMKVKDEANARFDAILRSYEYRISYFKDPFLEKLSYNFNKYPDVSMMNIAAKKLLEWHDFECFSKVKSDVSHYKCDIKAAYWQELNEMLIFSVSANRFLRGMVRAIVGTLLDVGIGKTSLEDFDVILKSKDRKAAGRAVPAHGLFLTGVAYPTNIFLIKD